MVGAVRGPADEAAVDEARRHESDVVEVGATGERVVEDDLLARRQLDAVCIDGGAHRRGHRAEMHGDVLGLHQQLAAGREQRG